MALLTAGRRPVRNRGLDDRGLHTPILNQAATTAAGSPVYFANPLPTTNLTGTTAVAFGGRAPIPMREGPIQAV